MELDCLTMIYKIPKYDEYKRKYHIFDYIFSSKYYYGINKKRILGEYFCRNNKNKGKLIINNRKSDLQEFIDIENNNEKQAKIKMILSKNIYNKSCMFKDCISLFELTINDNLEYLKNNQNLETNNFESEKNENNFKYEKDEDKVLDKEGYNKSYEFYGDDCGINEDNNKIYQDNIISDSEINNMKDSLKLYEFKYNFLNLKYIFYNCSSLN